MSTGSIIAETQVDAYHTRTPKDRSGAKLGGKDG